MKPTTCGGTTIFVANDVRKLFLTGTRPAAAASDRHPIEISVNVDDSPSRIVSSVSWTSVGSTTGKQRKIHFFQAKIQRKFLAFFVFVCHVKRESFAPLETWDLGGVDLRSGGNAEPLCSLSSKLSRLENDANLCVSIIKSSSRGRHVELADFPRSFILVDDGV